MASPLKYLFIRDPDSPISPFYTLPLGAHAVLSTLTLPSTYQNPAPPLIITANSKVFPAPKDRRQLYVLVPPLPYCPKVIEKSPTSSLTEAAATTLSILESTKWRGEDMPHIIELENALVVLDATNASLAR